MRLVFLLIYTLNFDIYLCSKLRWHTRITMYIFRIDINSQNPHRTNYTYYRQIGLLFVVRQQLIFFFFFSISNTDSIMSSTWLPPHRWLLHALFCLRPPPPPPPLLLNVFFCFVWKTLLLCLLRTVRVRRLTYLWRWYVLIRGIVVYLLATFFFCGGGWLVNIRNAKLKLSVVLQYLTVGQGDTRRVKVLVHIFEQGPCVSVVDEFQQNGSYKPTKIMKIWVKELMCTDTINFGGWTLWCRIC